METIAKQDSLLKIADNLDTVRAVMRAPFETFATLGKLTDLGASAHTPTRRFIHIDNGADVLAVAHLDSVQQYSGAAIDGNRLRCSTLDNRLGAYLILYGLPRLGLRYDILLTENEERGASTGAYFQPDKQYNWMFSFDRGDTDAVTYRYYCNEMGDRLRRHGMQQDYGTYSDIHDIAAGCKGVNWGCDMRLYHSQNAWVDLSTLDNLVSQFVGFYAEYHDTPMPHDDTDDAEMYADWECYDVGPTAYALSYYGKGTERDIDYWNAAYQKAIRRKYQTESEVWWMQHAVEETEAQDDMVECEYCGHYFEWGDLRHNSLFDCMLCRYCDEEIRRGNFG